MQLPTIKIPSRIREGKSYGMGSGFFDDLGDTLWSGVTGLTDALSGALQDIIHTVEQIGETIALVVRACMGQVSWSSVLDSLGTVFQDIGSAMVLLDPTRQLFDWLGSAKLTAHAFAELDKFTGGDLTTLKNLSDLPGRVLRGDPISKNELIKDALFIIQVVAIIVTFPEGLGVAVAMMIGKQVCAKQTEARDVCMAAFEVVGIAVGDWAADWSTATEDLADTSLETEFDNLPAEGSIEDAYNSIAADAGDAGTTSATTAATDVASHYDTVQGYLSDAAGTVLENQGITLVTREASILCQTNQWAGRNECNIMSTVLADYLKQDEDTDWTSFLAKEIGKIGMIELMLQWFPKNSPEYLALQRHLIVQVPTPLITPPVVTTQAGLNPWTFLILAAGAASVVMGAS